VAQFEEDPAEGVASTPLTYNPYIYGNDDLVDLVDPTGQEAIVECLLLQKWIRPIFHTIGIDKILTVSGLRNTD
jgi:hypothetical protein